MAEVTTTDGSGAAHPPAPVSRSNSFSQNSESSQTAAEFISSQLQLEADAREALPYQFDTCTKPLGALRQALYACLTCNPPPASPAQQYTPAGVCYSCSISCHCDHTLVELFGKRNFECDCGTTRIPDTSPCSLRLNEETGTKGGVHSEKPAQGNKYNQNFRNMFCGCEQDYDAHQEKGTMFQCLGLGTVEEGGCGEDWWHPECVVGLDRDAYLKSVEDSKPVKVDTAVQAPQNGISVAMDVILEEEPANGTTEAPVPVVYTSVTGGIDGNDLAANGVDDTVEDDDPPLPPGFPKEDDFETFICYKCVEAFPWIRRYAGSPGFLPPVYFKPENSIDAAAEDSTAVEAPPTISEPASKKRKASDEESELPSDPSIAPPKRQKSEAPLTESAPITTTLLLTPKKPTATSSCHFETLPPAPEARFSLFMLPDFRDHLCRSPSCFPLLKPHPQLLEEEETYEPPISEDGDNEGAASVGTGSILDRGEAVFNNMDRVKAIEGAMVYAHLKDKVRAFLQPFAESGQAVGAEDIKAYFEKLRGDADGIKDAAGGASGSSKKRDGGDGGGEGEGSGRKEQSGY
ncbi:hypothetical protein BU16DRAFT_509569 [Lophium mytilinum]|uniref:UBR-type domain-containing protein n=1 Tax=Lophium mytilinum TaxID=390894 RepID=A0A6A6QSB5_9PEZI|nr:hypothetical protein BU16DRAFT_509569 [Lophium mytilinum]